MSSTSSTSEKFETIKEFQKVDESDDEFAFFMPKKDEIHSTINSNTKSSCSSNVSPSTSSDELSEDAESSFSRSAKSSKITETSANQSSDDSDFEDLKLIANQILSIKSAYVPNKNKTIEIHDHKRKNASTEEKMSIQMKKVSKEETLNSGRVKKLKVNQSEKVTPMKQSLRLKNLSNNSNSEGRILKSQSEKNIGSKLKIDDKSEKEIKKNSTINTGTKENRLTSQIKREVDETKKQTEGLFQSNNSKISNAGKQASFSDASNSAYMDSTAEEISSTPKRIKTVKKEALPAERFSRRLAKQKKKLVGKK